MKVFRTIRYKLSKQNKLHRYLKYAFGEIVLVVIGILIALQINNWNQQRQQKKQLRAIYKIILDDLNRNVIEVDSFIVNYEAIRKPSFEALVSGNPTLQEIKANAVLFSKIFNGYEDIAVNTRGFDLFKQQSIPVLLDQDLSSKIDEFYNDHLIEIDIAQNELTTAFTYNNRYFESLDWSVKLYFEKKTEGYFNYLAKEPNAKRRAGSYYIYYSIYINELKRFRDQADILVQTITEYLAK
ncbi:DUF6090 family protein [Maribacter sp. CXY002]|uniref:DUF6090 family protein n=1 Tax=Maribacter luteocoastalis TaxID=3407671 RepID=UPI003B6719B2